jgi:hypothetical protein
VSVTAFPRFNQSSIPEALRKLANDIEAEPGLAERVVVVLDGRDAVRPRAFGDFTLAHAIGLLAIAQAAAVDASQ